LHYLGGRVVGVGEVVYALGYRQSRHLQ
jgi:hypothetical protein